MSYQSFEDLEIWKRSDSLAVYLYETLRHTRDFSLRDQMQRAAISIPSNIAEGCERSQKDFTRFLKIALGSNAELRTQACIAATVQIISDEQQDTLSKKPMSWAA